MKNKFYSIFLVEQEASHFYPVNLTICLMRYCISYLLLSNKLSQNQQLKIANIISKFLWVRNSDTAQQSTSDWWSICIWRAEISPEDSIERQKDPLSSALTWCWQAYVLLPGNPSWISPQGGLTIWQLASPGVSYPRESTQDSFVTRSQKWYPFTTAILYLFEVSQ